MTLRSYTIILGLGTAIIWAAWFVILVSIDPITAGALSFTIFYFTLFGGLVGLLTTISTLARSWNHPTRNIEDVVVTSLRQAVILALLFISGLILAHFALLNWLSLGGLLIVVGLLEAIFILRKKPTNQQEIS